MIKKSGQVQEELMDRLRNAPTAVGVLEDWIGYPGVITYDRYWMSSLYTMTTQEKELLEVPIAEIHLPGYKRQGFLRRGSGGEPMAFVQAVALRRHLPPWAVFELDNSNMTIGEMVIGRMFGKRVALAVEPVVEFDRSGQPLCIKVQARLDAIPHGGTEPRPLVLVTEWIYESVLGMRR